MEGLVEYMEWKVRKGEGNRNSYKEWVEAVRQKVRWQLDIEVHTVPTGKEGARKIKELEEALVFVKEDRGPHNWVAVREQLYKYIYKVYKHGRGQHVQGEGFKVTEEEEKNILDKHEELHMDNLLAVNRRLPYGYGICKAKNGDPRWISGARKQNAAHEGKP